MKGARRRFVLKERNCGRKSLFSQSADHRSDHTRRPRGGGKSRNARRRARGAIRRSRARSSRETGSSGQGASGNRRRNGAIQGGRQGREESRGRAAIARSAPTEPFTKRRR